MTFNISDLSGLGSISIPITVTVTRPDDSEPIDEDAVRAALNENLRAEITPAFEIATRRSVALGCSRLANPFHISSYKKMINLYKVQEKKELKTETCSVCLDSESTVETNCHHSFCAPCINKWTMKGFHENNEASCPCCRGVVELLYSSDAMVYDESKDIDSDSDDDDVTLHPRTIAAIHDYHLHDYHLHQMQDSDDNGDDDDVVHLEINDEDTKDDEAGQTNTV